MTHTACRLTAKNRDQLRNPTLGNRVWETFTSKRARGERERREREEDMGSRIGEGRREFVLSLGRKKKRRRCL